ncbi:MAG: helix-hairpin-helix domain-containing protein [Desulfotomaculum sp.]|nr:helix-hairpin-helix domain-containing protein [Desulfotomaculum sp.]
MFQIGRREQLVIVIVLAVLLFGGGYRYAQHKTVSEQPPVLVTEDLAEANKNQNELPKQAEIPALVVHVSGAVENPGVYRLETNSRVIDAVEIAVPTAEADLARLNLAAPLIDGQPIPVPAKVKVTEKLPGTANTIPVVPAIPVTAPRLPVATEYSPFTSAKININAANKSQLEDLPGVGPALSQRIIDYRQKQGGFKTIAEIKNVSGIGNKKYENMKHLISIF